MVGLQILVGVERENVSDRSLSPCCGISLVPSPWRLQSYLVYAQEHSGAKSPKVAKTPKNEFSIRVIWRGGSGRGMIRASHPERIGPYLRYLSNYFNLKLTFVKSTRVTVETSQIYARLVSW